jgi:hypothetical protein
MVDSLKGSIGNVLYQIVLVEALVILPPFKQNKPHDGNLCVPNRA